MAKCLEEQSKVVEKGDLLGYSKLDFDFHSMIYKTARNSFLQKMLESIKLGCKPINMHVKPILPQPYKDHTDIFEALQAKDTDMVEKAFVRHNENILNQIKKEMKVVLERVRAPT
jgi:DNA-binding GntR family transcriptional regulator